MRRPIPDPGQPILDEESIFQVPHYWLWETAKGHPEGEGGILIPENVMGTGKQGLVIGESRRALTTRSAKPPGMPFKALRIPKESVDDLMEECHVSLLVILRDDGQTTVIERETIPLQGGPTGEA
jgi:hypothetical protein